MQNVMIERPASGSASDRRQRVELGEIERAGSTPVQHHDADQQADVAGLRDPERLDRRARRGGALVPEADQQVRAEADQLPAHEQLQEVRRERQPHHREREQRLIGVVAAERGRRLVVQVAERIELHQQRHERDEAEHDRRLSRRRARRRRRCVFPSDGSHGQTSRDASGPTVIPRNHRRRRTTAPAHRIENHAAGRPRRRSGTTTASTRNDSAGRSSAMRAWRSGVGHHPLSRSR